MFRPFSPRTFEQVRTSHIRAFAARELRRRQRAPDSLLDHLHLTMDGYIEGGFVHRLVSTVEQFILKCEAKLSPRLMIFAPPRHGKSQIVSRALPSWFLGRNPRAEVIAASSTQDLADDFGLDVRNILNNPVYHDIFPKAAIDPASNSVSKVVMQAGGAYRAVGMNTVVVGRGANLLIIDDPIKDRKTAYSQLERDNIDASYRTNFRTRVAPGGGIILMHQRWHTDDLAGRLLARSRTNPDADQWEVLNLPAIAETDDDWRLAGEALFPERWNLKKLAALRAEMTEDEWLALFQQRPVKQEGGWFKADWFQYYSKLPNDLFWYIGADYAVSTDSRADNTAIIPVGIDHKRNLYVAPDFFLGKLEPGDAVNKTLELARKYKARHVAADAGPVDIALRAIFKERMRDLNYFIHIEGIRRSVKKHIIAASYHARMQNRSVWFPDNRLMREQFIPNHLNFIPEADNTHDDEIDAMANLCTMLDTIAAPVPDVPLPEVEEDPWDKILARGGAGEAHAPFARLNGERYLQVG
ncbi:MAG: hypothetical protein RL456_3241 [Pseudomonadota bacterium]|jgi:phage terminase large subunit-like protein